GKARRDGGPIPLASTAARCLRSSPMTGTFDLPFDAHFAAQRDGATGTAVDVRVHGNLKVGGGDGDDAALGEKVQGHLVPLRHRADAAARTMGAPEPATSAAARPPPPPAAARTPAAAATRACAKCGNTLRAAMRFCAKCGTPAE